MNDKTIALVRDVLATAGDMGQVAYAAAYRQAVIDGWLFVALAVTLTVVGVVSAVAAYRARNACMDAPLEAFGGIVAILCALCAPVAVVFAVRILANPGWAAIELLSGLVVK